MQAAAVGAISSQKAHNALRWLINRQCFRSGDQVIVSWAVCGKKIPQAMNYRNSFDHNKLTPEEEKNVSTHQHDNKLTLGQNFAKNLNHCMEAYHRQLQKNDIIVVLGIDSATQGRMGVTYYREYHSHDYINTISQWHHHFAWFQRSIKEMPEKPKKKVCLWPISAPTPWAIINTAYGDIIRHNESLKKHFYARLLPCIVEGRDIPFDIVKSCIQRASNNRACNPHSCLYSEWERNLGVACALYRGFYIRHPNHKKRRNYPMGLDNNTNSRDYLYGQLLAIAERIEETALYVSNINRSNTANRLMQRFSNHPYTTWLNIYKQIQPYIQQLQLCRTGFINTIKTDIDNIMNRFDKDAFTDDRPLSGEYLLGFHCQRLALRYKKESTNEPQKG